MSGTALISTPRGVFVGPINHYTKIIRNTLVSIQPGWAAAQISDKARYLGFVIGPGAGDETWDSTFEKARKKVEAWRAVGCSLFYSVTLFNVYILSSFSFICQVMNPPCWNKQEALLMRRLIRGPWLWAGPGIFKHPEQTLRFPTECGDLRATARAAQFRVACNEYRAEGGLLLKGRVARIDRLERFSPNTRLYNIWGKWLGGGFSRQLLANYENLKATPWEVSQTVVETLIAKGAPRPWTEKVARKVTKKPDHVPQAHPPEASQHPRQTQ